MKALSFPGIAELPLLDLPPTAHQNAAHMRRDADEARLRRDVRAISQPRGRRHAPDAMAAASSYVASELVIAGWAVAEQPFELADTDGLTGTNLLARWPGAASNRFLIGAHLDTVADSPGADDNASGVACLLEVARLAARTDLRRHVGFAIFDEEEFQLGGSSAYVSATPSRDLPEEVIIFECLGYVSDMPGSQRLPGGTSTLYRGQVARMRARHMRGDWTLVAYRGTSRELARTVTTYLSLPDCSGTAVMARDPIDAPIIGSILRRWTRLGRDFARSDHKSFWDRGITAIQLTDTANFRNPHYHQVSDLPDTLNYGQLADIAAATTAALWHRQGDTA